MSSSSFYLSGILVLALIVVPCTVLSQPGLEFPADRERQLIEQIEQEQSLRGPGSEGLIDPLTSLAQLYSEAGERRLAVTVMTRLREVVRANYGLYSLEQAPLIRQLIANAEAIDDFQTAWDLGQELLTLVRRNPRDIRTAGILREIGDKRMDVLDRYLAGGMPPQVILGCYYDWSSERDGGNCLSGSKQEAVRALISDAQRCYAEAIAVVLRNGLYSSDELRDLEMDLVRGSDLMRRRDQLNGRDQDFDLALAPPFLDRADPWRGTLDAIARLATWEIPDSHNGPSIERDARIGTAWIHSHLKDHYQLGRLALERIYAYEVATSAPLASQVDALVQIADWDLLCSQNVSALDIYERAYQMLQEATSDAGRSSIARIFSPTVPIALPAFGPTSLISDAAESSGGHIDVAFEITKYGESRRIKVLDVSEKVTESNADDLVRLIKRTLFRPRVVDGQHDRSTMVRLRYYLDE